MRRIFILTDPSCPLKLRLGASVVGGLIGAINPALFVFKPSYINYIQSHFHFDYAAYATGVLGFFLMLFLVPCILSTFILYPCLYTWLQAALQQRKRGTVGLLVSAGTKFGCLATLLTAFFLSTEFLLLAILRQKLQTIEQAVTLLFGGTFFLSFLGLCLLPIIVVTGSLYAWGNYRIISRKKHV